MKHIIEILAWVLGGLGVFALIALLYAFFVFKAIFGAESAR